MDTPLRLITAVLGSEGDANRVMDVLRAAGYVCAPVKPTAEMLSAAWAGAHDEDAAEVWREMIETIQRGQTNNGG